MNVFFVSNIDIGWGFAGRGCVLAISISGCTTYIEPILLRQVDERCLADSAESTCGMPCELLGLN
eukprot:IDg2085t1